MIVEFDLETCILSLRDRDRLVWIEDLLNSIEEDGTIEKVRDLVNDPKWNDRAT